MRYSHFDAYNTSNAVIRCDKKINAFSCIKDAKAITTFIYCKRTEKM